VLIYKIAFSDDWMDAVRTGVYAGSAKDKDDGFIHFSTAEQLEETLKLHYARTTRMLAVVSVEADELGESLTWEPARNGDLFPHLYVALPMAAVRSVVVSFYESLATDGFATIRDFIARRGAFAPENGAG
jgi:uncharacterized protein (DUF952 family)